MEKRTDGRGAGMLRELCLQTQALDFADASCLIRWGKTHVLCAATVEEGVPHFLRDSGRGWVTAEYSMLPRSGSSRIPRESVKGRLSGRTQEIQRLIGRSLRSVVDFSKLGERTLLIDCDVIQADGGTRCAAITGGFVALALAVRGLLRSGTIEQNPLRDFVGAVSVGIVEGRPLLDLDYGEDSAADVDMNLVMTGKGGFVEIQGTAEHEVYSEAELQQMLALGKKGIKALVTLQKQALKINAIRAL